ncbi:MAG: hypothetical protein ACQEWU_05315 [Bacillota bacterium]|uniref:hypothetical protein n=1 Tax=Virgibacillus sp. M23 TaxID=3079030 RepID=UPI000425EF98|nr:MULTISPECIES: hypothetical protein [Bacillaceae]MDY7044019.1 hypothetical protein [Virgibacillus sp. M23]
MNKIAISLYVVGVFAIIAGVILGLQDSATVVTSENILGEIEYEETITWTIFWAYTIGGIISGIMMFGFGEIIRILDEKKEMESKSYEELMNIKQYLVGSEEKHNVHRTQDNSLEDKTETFDDIQYPSSYSNQDTDNSDTKKGKGLSGLIDEAVNGKK